MRFALRPAQLFVLSLLFIATPAFAEQTYALEIESQALSSALKQFAEQSGLQVVYYTRVAAGRTASRVAGQLSASEALRQLLAGTNLTFEALDERTVAIRAPASTYSLSMSSERGPSSDWRGGAGEDTQGEGKAKSFWSRLRLAQTDPASKADTQGAEGEDQTNTQSSNQSSEKRAALEEIIVTATKRQERVQDIPISIAVITNQDIERRGLVGMEDYLRSVPGVNQIDRGSIDNAIIIRGITTSPSVENFGSGATVASYFDETPITGAAGLLGGGIDVRPVDIERIEVLRGPQGTAYGSSSLGGTLRIIPVKPHLADFAAKVTASYSGTSGHGSDNSMFQGVLNIPIVENKFALRAVGYRYDESGIYQNIVGIDPAATALAASWGIADDVRDYVPEIGGMVSTGGRLAAAWQVTDALDISMNVLTQDIEQEGFPAASVGAYGQVSFPIDSGARLGDNKEEGYENNIDLLSFVLNYDFGWAALTSATSWVDGDTVGVRDGWTVSTGFGGFSLPDRSDFKSLTEEIRLASQLQGRAQFLAGLFYEDVKPGNLQLLIPFGAPAPNPFGTDPAFIADRDVKTKQRAVFGEVSYDLTQKLTARVGGRYFDYNKNERLLREGGLVRVPLGTGVPVISESGESDSTFKANLGYRPTDNSLVYASWSQGFRLGKPSNGVPPATCDIDNDGLVDGTNVTIESTREVNSDFLDNYEIGGKFTLFDRRLVVDTAIYHIEWEGLPANAVAPTCRLFYLANAGAATSDGAEFQASLFALEHLRFDFGVGYTKGELSEDVPAQNWRTGARLPGSPKVNANLAAQYDFGLATHQAFIRFDSFYTGAFYGDLLETPALRAGDYIKLDARAGVMLGSLSVELFARNLTDQDDVTWRSAGNAPGSILSYRLRPRTIGVQLSYDF